MSKITVVKIILTLILSVVIAFSVNNYLLSLKQEADVYIVTSNISQKTVVEMKSIKKIGIREKDKKLLFARALNGIKENEVIIAVKDIEASAVLSTDNVIHGSKKELIEDGVLNSNGRINDSYFLKKEKRLVSIMIDKGPNLSEKVKKGDYVDIVFTLSDSKNTYSLMLAQHIEVFDIDQSKKGSSSSPYEVYLSVTPQQAIELTHAKRTGSVDLILNPFEGYNELVSPVNSKALLKGKLEERELYE